MSQILNRSNGPFQLKAKILWGMGIDFCHLVANQSLVHVRDLQDGLVGPAAIWHLKLERERHELLLNAHTIIVSTLWKPLDILIDRK